MPNTTFTVDIGVANNNQAPVQGYMFRVHYDGNSVSLTGIQDVDLGGAAPSLGPVEGSGNNTWRDAGTLGNFSNTLYNLTLCRLTFTVSGSPAPSYSIWVEGDPDNEPLIDVYFQPIPHWYDNSVTDPIICSPTPTPTATPTGTPTGTPLP